MSEKTPFVAPRVQLCQPVLFRAGKSGDHPWFNAYVTGLGHGGIDLHCPALDAASNPSRENVRHIDDPMAEEKYYKQQMSEQQDGGLWKLTTETTEFQQLQERVAGLEERVSELDNYTCEIGPQVPSAIPPDAVGVTTSGKTLSLVDKPPTKKKSSPAKTAKKKSAATTQEPAMDLS